MNMFFLIFIKTKLADASRTSKINMLRPLAYLVLAAMQGAEGLAVKTIVFCFAWEFISILSELNCKLRLCHRSW